MVKKYIDFLQFTLIFVFLSLIPNTIYGQCAGGDGVFTVCDIPATSSQSINLFTKLTGSPITGGVWSDDDGTGGLNATTGILNAQQIRRSGIFHYTYTVEGVGLCPDNSSTVTVTVGGYAGVPSNAVICSSAKTYNLFQAFNGLYLGAQSNGQWHNDTTNGNVDSVIDVENLDGDYPFTYTMPAIGTCPAVSSTVVISVYRAPKSGIPSNLILCSTDGLTAYTNVDLNSLLSNQDSNGTWKEDSGTDELTYAGDHFVDVQKIYSKFGNGTYNFSYKVLSTKNSICLDAITTVQIIIEKKLNFTGATMTVNSDICETDILTATYSVTINRNTAAIPDGNYTVGFTVSGSNGGSDAVQVTMLNGVISFPLKSQYFQRVGNYTVSIYDIYSVASARACQNIFNLSDVLTISPIPDLIGAKIAPIAACQNTSTTVNISEATRVADGTYDIVFNISGANTASGQTVRVDFQGGNASFPIQAILNSQSGNGVITITKITRVLSNGSIGCTNSANIKGDIVINPLPNATNLKIQVNDVCFGSPVSASVTGLGTLADVTLFYTLSGNNVSTEQSIALTSTNGNATFVIPASLLTSSGTSTINITKLTNNSTTCSSSTTGVTDGFQLNPIPVAPVTNDQSFCKSIGATVASLQPNGTQYKWYNSATLTTPLSSTYVLKEENYYVTETTLGCTSPSTMIKVALNDTPAPELIEPAEFCGLNNPTVLDLSNKTNVPSTVLWYDSRDKGNLIPSTAILVEGKKYYGFDFSTTINCYSNESIEVTASLTHCDNVPNDFFIPDGFSPNGDGINDTFVIPDINFLYPDYSLEIFNRYGNRMYKGFKDKAGWDGTNWETTGFAHGIAPNGVYFYVLYFNKDNKPPQQGRLYLNR